jgi:ribonuclease D
MITQSDIEYPSTIRPVVGPTRLPLPVLVDSPVAFREMIAALGGQSLLALDTESDSLYRYFFKVGLIQISTLTTDYLVDPLRLPDLMPLGEIMADPAVEKVFHAAENDILMLKRDFGFRFANVFDTMLAARILGWQRVSLAALLAQHFGVTLDKRAQLTDWGHRPLDAAQLSYARLDTHYLLPLRDLLIDELNQRRRWREAREAFAALPQITYIEKPFDPDGFWRIKGARDLRGNELAVLRQLYLWRDEQARQLDRPPFKVLGDDRLVELSRQQPSRLADLPLNPRQTGLFGKAILAAVAAGRTMPAPQPPARPANGNGRPTPETLVRFDQLRAWRVRRAADRAVDADLVLTNDALMTIARAAPATLEALAALGVMGTWKMEEYGTDLLRVIEAGA